MNSLKCIFILILFILSGINTLYAQVGIKVGVGVSDIVIDKAVQSQYLGYEVNTLNLSKPLTAYHVGITGAVKIVKSLDFQPELLYIKQGTQLQSDFIYDNITYKIKVRYLHLPLLINSRFLLNKKWHPRILTGPYISYKLKALKSLETNNSKKEEDFPAVKNYDFGLVIGFSVDIDMAAGQIILDLRASYSLVNTIDKKNEFTPPYQSSDKEWARNSYVIFSVGYRWASIFNNK
jgi:hypothetical protein